MAVSSGKRKHSSTAGEKGCVKKCRGDRWTVERIACFDEQVGSEGGVIRVSNSAQGDITSFHPVDWKSLQLSAPIGDAVVYETKAITDAAKTAEAPQLWVDLLGLTVAQRKLRVRDAITEWCVRNPGHAVTVGGSGARPRIQELSSFLVRTQGKVFMRDNRSSCIISAIVNAVYLLRGHAAASGARDKLLALQEIGGSVASHGAAVRKLNIHLDVKNPKDERFRSFGGYGCAEERVLIVRLLCGNLLDHTVCLDVWNGLVYDSAEQYPLRLTEKSLFLCAGGKKGKSRIAEVRELGNSRMKGNN